MVTLSSGTWFTATDSNANFCELGWAAAAGLCAGPEGVRQAVRGGDLLQHVRVPGSGAGSFGNVSLNTLNGPGNKNWDASLLKTVRFGEVRRLELRGEFYNVLNHPNLLFAGAGPQNSNNATTFGSSNFGVLTAARDPRLIQIGAKIYY